MILFRHLFATCTVLLPAVCLLGANPTTRVAARDLHNQPQQIPTPGRPTVLVFLRPGQPQSEQQISEISHDLGNAKQLSILGVVSGSPATRPTTMEAMQWTWPILPDETYAISGAFEVFAWPTTIVFDAQGSFVGRIADHPLNHRANLTAYVAYASGTTTLAQMEDELNRQQVVQDDADQKAHRHLLIAQQFLTSGRTDDAATQVRKAQELQPSAPAVRLLMARELLILGETAQADALLATIDKTSQPEEFALLRGRCAIALGHWDDAKGFLHARPISSEPAIAAETLYWQGILHTRDADYRHAADAFRKAYEAANLK